jgi:hypothetical protein
MHMDMNHDSTNHNHTGSEIHRERVRTQETAQRMTVLAVRQWERALGGLLAVPSAIAVSCAAGAMLVTSVVERTFEVIELTTMDVGRRLGPNFDSHGEPRNGRPAEHRDAAAS